MDKSFLDWFAKAKTISQVNRERELAEFNGEVFVEPDIFDFDEFSGKDGEGTTTKAIVMIKGKFLKELFDEIKNNSDTSYVTCVNDYIKNSTWEEFAKFPVPIYGKQARNGDNSYNRNELVYSRLANIFGLKTVYSFPLNSDCSVIASINVPKVLEPSNIENTDKEIKQQHIESLNDFIFVCLELGRRDPISRWIGVLNDAIARHSETKQMTEEQIDNLRYDTVFEYIMRRYVFKDNDYQGSNAIVIHDGDYKNLVRGPSMDYEFCGDMKIWMLRDFGDSFNDRRREDLNFLKKTHPDIFDKIMKSINNTWETRQEDINKVFKTFAPNPSYTPYWGNLLKLCVKGLRDDAEKIIDEPSSTM